MVGFWRFAPGGFRTLLPEMMQLIESGLARKAMPGEPAANNHTRSIDPAVAMHLNHPVLFQPAINRIQDRAGEAGRIGHRYVPDREPLMADRFRFKTLQQVMVW